MGFWVKYKNTFIFWISTLFALADEATLLLFYILMFKPFQLSFGFQEEADVITMYFWFNEMDAVCQNDNIVNGGDITEVTALAPPPHRIPSERLRDERKQLNKQCFTL